MLFALTFGPPPPVSPYVFLLYDFLKAIIDSIRLYFDFIDDLLDLGLVSHDSLNNLNDFYMGKYRN